MGFPETGLVYRGLSRNIYRNGSLFRNSDPVAREMVSMALFSVVAGLMSKMLCSPAPSHYRL